MGTGEKRQTMILGGGALPEGSSVPAVPAAQVSPRNALPPPPHIRRSVVPDHETMKDLDAGWESMRPGSNRPVSNAPATDRPSPLSQLIHGKTRVASNRPAAPRPTSDRPAPTRLGSGADHPAARVPSDRPISNAPLSALVRGRAATQTEPVPAPEHRGNTEPIPAIPPSARQPMNTLAPTSFARRSQLPPVMVRGSSNVPLSRSVAMRPSTPLTPTPMTATSVKPPAPLFLASQLPPPPSSKRLFAQELEEIPSSELLEVDDRPSDRKTVPNDLRPKTIEELSASDLESDPSLITTRPPPPSRESANQYQPSLSELATAIATATPLTTPSKPARLPVPDEAYTPSSLPPVSMDARPPLTSQPSHLAHSLPVPQMSRQWLAIFAASHVAVAASVLFWVYATRTEPKPHPREPHIALEQRTLIESVAGEVTENATPADSCKVQDLARVIATRAELGPALDATALESGFGVGLVSKSHEATGIRLEASTLRTAEVVKVRTSGPVTRVDVDKGDSEEDRLEVRVDGNDTKTLSPTQKIVAAKGGVFSTDANGTPKLLWAIPGVVPKTTEMVRAISRDDGSALVAVRRSGLMWIGVTGQGGIVPVVRDRKTLGTPTLASIPGGGLVAWAERGSSGPFSIVVAEVSVDGKHTHVQEPEVIAEGISPALATLPNGELLLTYSDGKAGAHRVVAQRFSPDLTRRGDLLVLSSPGLNAGQPAVAVDSEGRAIVAYLAIENGRAEVHATSMTCR